MSYKRAWDLVDEINRICRQAAVERQTGGKNGGGAVLTPFGRSLVARYRKIERDRRERGAQGACRHCERDRPGKEARGLITSGKYAITGRSEVPSKQSRKLCMPHPAMSPNNVAVITGGASGIGLAAATRFAGLGMKVCIADIGADRLAEAAATLASVAKGGAADVMTATVDVSRFDDVAGLETAVQKRFGGTDILMNNAGIGPDSNSFGPLENWQRILAVNLWGVIHGTQALRRT